MMGLLIFSVGWIMCSGISITIFCVYNKSLTLNELLASVFFGPVSILALIIHLIVIYGDDTIIWKKKTTKGGGTGPI